MAAANWSRQAANRSLAEGELDGTTIVCPWHGWEYDITTGANLDDPSVKLGCYPVKADGDDILVEA
jgi:nitrite reductase (NADH) small subunit